MKKVFSTVRRVLVLLLTVFSCTMLVLAALSAVGLNRETGAFGFQFYTVLSDSMTGVFDAGDIVVSQTVDPGTLREGDIITFRSVDPQFYGLVVTHKISALTATDTGALAFDTYGIASESPDETPAPAANVLGAYRFRIPKAGYLVDYFHTPAGYATLVLLPFLLIILLMGAHFLGLLRAYRAERREAYDEQERVLETEREKAAQALEELARVRAKMQELGLPLEAETEAKWLPPCGSEEAPPDAPAAGAQPVTQT
ncbi:MAG: signal peptidase I [Oscillospiraceae bacterium]|jgi:signal peptidase|nr:signal peptidase I [Oscillospiraceae bacterium]